MKKYILSLVIGLVLIASIIQAAGPGDSSITMATGTAQAPIAVHNVIFPSTTLALGNKPAGSSQSAQLTVTNDGNVPENIKATILSSNGVTINSAVFMSSNLDTVTLNSGNAIFKVDYQVNSMTPGSPDSPISIEIKFEVL